MPRVRPCLLVRSRVGAAALCLAALARAGSVALDAGDDLAPQGHEIAGVPSGTYRVLVRGVGSQPVELRTRLASGDTTWLQLAVARASAPQRATVPVRDRASGNAAFDALGTLTVVRDGRIAPPVDVAMPATDALLLVPTAP
ncbi:MAG: hypothetical protein ACXWZS_16600 [Gemmatirosa sp.]